MELLEIKIEKNVPLSKKGKRGGVKRSIYPFVQMGIGDSFFLQKNGKPLKNVQINMANSIKYFKKKYPEWKFATRIDKENEGLRVWRTN